MMGMVGPLALLLAVLAPANEVAIPDDVDLDGSFSVFLSVRMDAAPGELPLLASNKAWTAGEVVDYTTHNAWGPGRASGSLAGFAVSVLPDGAWTWNAGDGSGRLDHRPEAADQGIADGRWHEVGFSLDRRRGVAHLFHDGRRVAVHDLQGLGGLGSDLEAVQLGEFEGLELANVRIEPGVRAPQTVEAEFIERFGEARRPRGLPAWDGGPLRVLAWNIWHGGRRKGVDEGVRRVVEVIEQSGADIVLMQETYGSGPRIAGRLGFEYYLRSSNLSVMSRFPIRDVHRLAHGFRLGGATIELRPGLHVQAYSLWINHLPSVQEHLAAGATGAELAAADQVTRGAELDTILAALLPHVPADSGVPLLVGGDFNSGSHLDWTEAAAALPNHAGRVVAWPASVAMEAAGFVDTYRAAHPDPVEFPGLTWSPEFPESHQDRIDYVYARGDRWTVEGSRVLSSHPDGWPSDHAAVLSTLRLAEAPNRLRVMSYNIKHGRGNDGVIDLERAAAVIEAAGPDVVTLQEVDQGCGRSGGVDQAAWLGQRLGMEPRFGPFMDYDGGRYGMAVLSRLPIVASENLVLPPGAEPRSALSARVRMGDGTEVVVVGLHLYATESERLAQARAVVEAFAEERAPVVLAGDLNSEPGSPVLRLFEQAWTHPDKGEDRLTFHAQRPEREIDFILYRSAIPARAAFVDVLDEPLASDHRPLLLDLMLGD